MIRESRFGTAVTGAGIARRIVSLSDPYLECLRHLNAWFDARRPDNTCRRRPANLIPYHGKTSMDETKLGEAAAKAMRARELLDNELLGDAFKSLEESYTSAWRASGIDDVAGREKLFLAINIVGKVRDHLATIVTNGKLAQAELKELARTAERRKRFGIV